MTSVVREVELAEGERVLARLTTHEEGGLGEDERAVDQLGEDAADFRDTGAVDRLADRAERLNELITRVGSSVRQAATAAAPDEVTVVFGVELALRSGGAVAVLADGESKASVSVSLTWRSERDQRRP